MVALPTPAFAATASMEMAAALSPSASRPMTASRMASSAWTLRGRPGALRSWPVSTSVLTVVMAFIVTDVSCFDQFHALFLGEPLRGAGRGSAGRAQAGQPDRGDRGPEQGDHGGADRGVMHRGDEGVVRVPDQLRSGR